MSELGKTLPCENGQTAIRTTLGSEPKDVQASSPSRSLQAVGYRHRCTRVLVHLGVAHRSVDVVRRRVSFRGPISSTTTASWRIWVLCGVTLISSQALAQAPPPTVTVATPLSRVIADWDESTGRFTPSQSVEVRPRVTGFVDALYFRDGQLVKPGDLLFTIDPRPYQIAVDSTQADVDRTSAAVEIAALEVHRGEPLVPAQALPQSQLDMRRSTLRQAQANRDSALAALHNAQLNLSWTEVRAPIAGRISDRRVDVGNLVNGGQNGMTPTLLTTIVALDPIYLEFDAAEADYLKYVRLAHSGQRPSGRIVRNPVEVKLQDETTWLHKGTLDFIDNVVNSRSGTIRGRGIFDNGDQLLTLEDLREFGYGPETPKCC